jgi:dTMP kinase
MVLNDTMDAMTEALLVFAARRDHIQNVIRPALESGHVVLCDRFTDATFAYQGGGRGFDWNVLVELENWVQSAPSSGSVSAVVLQPDLTVWFDLPAEVAARRLAGARVPDKFESQSTDFFVAVAAGYLRRYEGDIPRFARVQADQTPEAVWQALRMAVVRKGWLL